VRIQITADFGHTYLANIYVGAIRVNLGVVDSEDGGVDIICRGDYVAVVVKLDRVRRSAIVACGSQAQSLPWREVRAPRVDRRV
jgi:hypothetical protein